jgi:hypothetical protein
VLFAPLFLACCFKAHPAVRRELALRAQTALLTRAGFRQEQQRLGTKVAAKHPRQLPFLGLLIRRRISNSGAQESGVAQAATVAAAAGSTLIIELVTGAGQAVIDA